MSTPTPAPNVGYSVTHLSPSITEELDHDGLISSHSLKMFVRRERKTLGIVQIMVGLLILAFGIVFSSKSNNISVYSGLLYWMPLLCITTGSLTVAVGNKPNPWAKKVCVAAATSGYVVVFASIFLMILDLPLNDTSCYPDIPDCPSEFTEMLQSLDLAVTVVLVLFLCLHIFTCFFIIASFHKLQFVTVVVAVNTNLETPPADSPPQNTQIQN